MKSSGSGLDPLPSFEERLEAWELGRRARLGGETAYMNPYGDKKITLARAWIDGYVNHPAPSQ